MLTRPGRLHNRKRTEVESDERMAGEREHSVAKSSLGPSCGELTKTSLRGLTSSCSTSEQSLKHTEPTELAADEGRSGETPWPSFDLASERSLSGSFQSLDFAASAQSVLVFVHQSTSYFVSTLVLGF